MFVKVEISDYGSDYMISMQSADFNNKSSKSDKAINGQWL